MVKSPSKEQTRSQAPRIGSDVKTSFETTTIDPLVLTMAHMTVCNHKERIATELVQVAQVRCPLAYSRQKAKNFSKTHPGTDLIPDVSKLAFFWQSFSLSLPFLAAKSAFAMGAPYLVTSHREYCRSCRREVDDEETIVTWW